MGTQRRLSHEERRESILQAVVPVFARKGFHGATSRELAEACGISEALLYRHFRDKPSLYAAIARRHVTDWHLHPGLSRLKALPPSTERLVLAAQYLFCHFLDHDRDDVPRLLVQSLLGDGEFAGALMAALEAEAGALYAESLEAAARAGDLLVPVEDLPSGMFLAYLLSLALRLFALPARSGAPGLLLPHWPDPEAATRFALRGLGLRPEALERDYHPGAWKDLS